MVHNPPSTIKIKKSVVESVIQIKYKKIKGTPSRKVSLLSSRGKMQVIEMSTFLQSTYGIVLVLQSFKKPEISLQNLPGRFLWFYEIKKLSYYLVGLFSKMVWAYISAVGKKYSY